MIITSKNVPVTAVKDYSKLSTTQAGAKKGGDNYISESEIYKPAFENVELEAEIYDDGTAKITTTDENGKPIGMAWTKSKYLDLGKEGKTENKVESKPTGTTKPNESNMHFEQEKMNDGNILYVNENYTDENGDFHRITYDENGNKIDTHYYKDGSYTEDYRNENKTGIGERVIDRYDSNGKLTNRRSIDDIGNEYYSQYDANGNIISSEVTKIAKRNNENSTNETAQKEKAETNIEPVQSTSEQFNPKTAFAEEIVNDRMMPTETNDSQKAVQSVEQSKNILDKTSNTTNAFTPLDISSIDKLDEKTELIYKFDGSNLDEIKKLQKEKGARFGIDISHYQYQNTPIDWKAVKESGISYAMIKWGGRSYKTYNKYIDGDEPTVGVTPTAEQVATYENAVMENIKSAIDAGLDVGLYTWGGPSSKEKAVEEAHWTIEFIDKFYEKYPDYKGKINMPIGYDLESFDNWLGNTSKEQLTENIAAFNKEMEKAGYKTMTYSYISGLTNTMDAGKLLTDNNYIWSSDPNEGFDYNGSYQMHQYNTGYDELEGIVNGIAGRVDLNVFYEDPKAKTTSKQETIKKADTKTTTQKSPNKNQNKAGGLGIIENAVDLMTRLAKGEITAAELQLQAGGIDTSQIKDGYKATRKIDTEIGTVVLSEKEDSKPMLYLFDKAGKKIGKKTLDVKKNAIKSIEYNNNAISINLSNNKDLIVNRYEIDEPYRYELYEDSKNKLSNRQSYTEEQELIALNGQYGDIISKKGDYDWEAYYNLFQNHTSIAEQAPSEDIDNSFNQEHPYYKNLEVFNKHITDNVNAAGRGTREAVVAAGKSLIVDYTLQTGNRLRYSMSGKRQLYGKGIEKEDFYLDCSSFAAWALVNGGYKISEDMNGFTYTQNQETWANNNGYNVNPSLGKSKPGDFMVCHSNKGEHIALIVDNDGKNYYTAEFTGDDTGGEIKKYTYAEAANNFDIAIDMDNYYNNPKNREK